MARPKKASQAKGDTGWVRDRLLDAAETLFARNGYGATSLRDIGGRVGVSNATVLHHFGSKLELYRAVLDRLALAVRTLVDASAAEPTEAPLPSLLRFLQRFADWSHENPNYGHIAFREFMDKTVRETHLDYDLESDVLRRLAEIVRRGQREGAFRPDVDAETFVVQLLTTVWVGEVSRDTFAMLFERTPEELQSRFRMQAIANLLRGFVAEPDAIAAAAERAASPESMQ